jgi:MoaA/NifB/PqqE/SkfB family radical SAM enzyme
MNATARIPFVVADIVVRESNCNLSCTYCLTGQSEFKAEHSLHEIFEPPVKQSCAPDTDLGRRLRRVVRAPGDAGTPVVKLSGGEVLVIDGIDDVIAEASGRYETVVVLTNGLPLSRARVARFEALGNVVLQVSCDSTRQEGNSYRCPDERTHQAAVSRLREVLDSALPVELYLVLHDRSVGTLAQTLEDLRPWAGRLTVFPFPVRGPECARFQVREDQQRDLFELIDRADQYAGLLPGRPYLDRLRRFYAGGGRGFRCHLPRVAFGAFDDGVATSCPNIWFNQADNLLERAVSDVYQTLHDAPFRRLLLAPTPRIDACRACFTPWDPVSLYFEDQLSREELGRIPIYRGARTLDALAAIKADWRR